MAYQFYNEAKAYILYREKRKEKRQMLLELCHEVQDEKLLPIFMQIQKDFDETYDLHDSDREKKCIEINKKLWYENANDNKVAVPFIDLYDSNDVYTYTGSDYAEGWR